MLRIYEIMFKTKFSRYFQCPQWYLIFLIMSKHKVHPLLSLSPPPTSPHAAYLPTNQFFYYFLLIYISFYISRYHFCNFLELHLTLSEKRFLSEFSFITHNSPWTPPALNITANICYTLHLKSLYMTSAYPCLWMASYVVYTLLI